MLGETRIWNWHKAKQRKNLKNQLLLVFIERLKIETRWKQIKAPQYICLEIPHPFASFCHLLPLAITLRSHAARPLGLEDSADFWPKGSQRCQQADLASLEALACQHPNMPCGKPLGWLSEVKVPQHLTPEAPRSNPKQTFTHQSSIQFWKPSGNPE